MDKRKTRKERNSTGLTQKGLSNYKNIFIEFAVLRTTTNLDDKVKKFFF
jgi:hypothetical protein